MHKLKRPLLKIILFFCVFFTLERLCHRQTRGFSLPNIYADEKDIIGLQKVENLKVESLSNELLTLLSQPFTFLDSGLECYAFISQDKETVLKLFKYHHVKRARWLAKLLPLPYFTQLYQVRKERLTSTFESCKIAEKELKEETGLLLLHLSETSHSLPIVTLIDKLGLQHLVALDKLSFILQKKADLLVPTLEKSVKLGDTDAAKRSISSLLALISQRCKKGIADRDPTLGKNYGFIQNEAIVIDIGSFSKNPFLMRPQIGKRSLFYETLPLRCLLEKQFPDLVTHFEEELQHILQKRDE